MSGDPTPTIDACAACLRRCWLVDHLAGWIETAAARRAGSRVRELLALPDDDLARALCGGARARQALDAESLGSTGDGRRRSIVAQAGQWAVCRCADAYPPALRDAPDAPAVLLGVGAGGADLLADAGTVVTVVGARRATAYGRGVARELGAELAAAGLVVASGLALGIDGDVHRGVLEVEGGPPVAVLPGGADTPYPRRHHGLWDRIVRRGAAISERPPGAQPWRWSFPARNRTMAGLACATVVVEAAHRSGSLITAEVAADLGRTVGAVPGAVTSPLSAGANELLADGALVVRGAADILDLMLGPGAHQARGGPALDDQQRPILAAIEAGHADADAIAQAAGFEAGAASRALTSLELAGYVRADGAGLLVRTGLDPPSSAPDPADSLPPWPPPARSPSP
ncbi:MAG: DNA-processing protein DprA [Solirubrobacterales bacterium]